MVFDLHALVGVFVDHGLQDRDFRVLGDYAVVLPRSARLLLAEVLDGGVACHFEVVVL